MKNATDYSTAVFRISFFSYRGEVHQGNENELCVSQDLFGFENLTCFHILPLLSQTVAKAFRLGMFSLSPLHGVFISCAPPPPVLHRYADLLQKKLDRHGTQCFLVNTGWTGGGYGVGKRMSLKDTRACVDSVLNGTINKSSFTPDPVSAARRVCAARQTAVQTLALLVFSVFIPSPRWNCLTWRE